MDIIAFVGGFFISMFVSFAIMERNVCWCVVCGKIQWGKLWRYGRMYCSEACILREVE